MTVWYRVAVLVSGRLFSRWRSLCTGWFGLKERAWASSRLISFIGPHWPLIGSVAYFSPHIKFSPGVNVIRNLFIHIANWKVHKYTTGFVFLNECYTFFGFDLHTIIAEDLLCVV